MAKIKKDETEIGITGKPIPKKRLSPKNRYEFEKNRRKHLGQNVGGVTYKSDVTPNYNPRTIRNSYEPMSFKEFMVIAEAKRIRVLRTAHYTSASNKENILKSGFKDSPSTGTYHPDDRKGVVYTTPSSRVGSDYGSSRVNLRLVNPKVKRTDSPRDFGKNIKNWMASASDEDIADKKGKPTSSVDQAKSAFKQGAKVVKVPNAHGGFTPKPGQAQGSYVMMDKDVANKSIDRTPSRTMRAKDKERRTKTKPKSTSS